MDGSAQSLAALDTATHLLDGARCNVTVATVLVRPWLPPWVYPPGLVLAAYDAEREAEKRRTADARALVERACATLKERGFSARGTVLEGAAGTQLLKEADNISADLVVVGARGLGPIRRAFLGSVSDQIVRHAGATLVGRGPA